MIFSLTDETYSLLVNIKNEEGHADKLMFLISFLDQCYWIIGSILGSLIGSMLPFDTTGIDFALIALFVVIFTEQWLSCSDHRGEKRDTGRSDKRRTRWSRRAHDKVRCSPSFCGKRY